MPEIFQAIHINKHILVLCHFNFRKICCEKQSADWCEKIPDPVERRYWSKIFERVRTGQIDSWAYPWTASVWFHGGLTATPNVNLVSNIGFGPDSTHTASTNSHLAGMVTEAMGKITHPKTVVHDHAASGYDFDHTFGRKYQRFPNSLIHLPLRAMRFFCRQFKRALRNGAPFINILK